MSVVEPYKVIGVQMIFERYNPDLHGKFPPGLKERNVQRMCDLVDLACTRTFPASFHPPQTKLVAFPEFSIGGEASPKTITKEIQEYLAISIPGPETERLARKAKEHKCYIATANFENDPDYPNWCFNTGFIINPHGKIILKYRKIHTSSQPYEFTCCPHDILDVYKNPISSKFDPFPVVDTEIGKLGMMICGDVELIEIPRVYGLKGCEVLIYVTAGANEAMYWAMRNQAFWNSMYVVLANGASVGTLAKKAGEEWVIDNTEAAMSGWTSIFDYKFWFEPLGNLVAKAVDRLPQMVAGTIDVMALRQYRQTYLANKLSNIRTELYAPYYAQTIFPPNQYLKAGPIQSFMDKRQVEMQRMAMENLQKIQQNPDNWYSEKDVK